jgi:hypothetical protein
MSIEQGEHNEALCEELAKSGKWNDWVITTAFYSALHFVENKIFPLKIKDTTYNSFDLYYPSRTDNSRGQHEARLRLVKERLNMAYSSYRFLYNNSRTARYNNYKVSPEMASMAKLKLAVVKSLCIKSAEQKKLS